MSLVINNNFMAINAARNLGAHFGALESSTRKLSSGLRITRSSDDAAGLAVRELMRADIAALNQGIRNANDAISLIQTADGALNVIDEKLIRMKELAMQASTGTYNSDQRLIIESEYKAMALEITRIANSTDFNGIYLLNGNLSGSHDGSSLKPTGQLKVHFGTGNDCSEDYYYIQIGSVRAASLGLGEAAIATATELENQYAAGLTLLSTDTLANQAAKYTGFDTDYSYDTNQIVNEYDAGGGQTIIYATNTDGELIILYFNAGNFDFSDCLGQVEDTLSSISTQHLSQEALSTINHAIISKDKIRANLGALQNRLENTVTTLEIQAENLQAAESRISDVDVAKEMTNFVRNQILSQAALSMLAQANSMPRMALSLIG